MSYLEWTVRYIGTIMAGIASDVKIENPIINAFVCLFHSRCNDICTSLSMVWLAPPDAILCL